MSTQSAIEGMMRGLLERGDQDASTYSLNERCSQQIRPLPISDIQAWRSEKGQGRSAHAAVASRHLDQNAPPHRRTTFGSPIPAAAIKPPPPGSRRSQRGFLPVLWRDPEWQKLRERNEALDCRVYARAAVWIVGADRWLEARWADLDAQLWVAAVQGAGVETSPATTVSTAGAVRPIRRPVQRRTVRSTYMSHV